MNTDVLIAGGGLSGLRLADRLSAAGVDYRLIEGRGRLGGRILSLPASGATEPGDRYDLGPAWFWPDQPRMQRLIDELDLVWFEQMWAGNLVMQEQSGAVRNDFAFSTMAGARRIVGGAQSLIEALARKLTGNRILLDRKLLSLHAGDDILTAEIETAGKLETISARAVVVTIPPRLLAETIAFTPLLDEQVMRDLSSIPTWMAGHAKVVAVYERPFWRAKGLSGDAISRIGPLVEIHDASPASEQEGALFGFVGVPSDKRRGYDAAIIDASIAQLVTLFGAEAAHPKDVLYEDWSVDRFTATEQDASGNLTHPSYGPLPPLDAPWAGRVFFASTEMALQYGGFLEGALEAAEQVLREVTLAKA